MSVLRHTTTTHPSRARAAGAFVDGSVGWARVIAVGLAVGALSACVATTKSPADAKQPAEKPVKPERVSDVAAPGSPQGTALVDSALRLDLRPLGSVATDGFTLPLLSPNGRFLAVQTGTPPDAATALARPGQRAPRASRIAIYQIDARSLSRLGETDGGFILGRSADDNGFLFESPRPDGSRWIGRIPWGTETATKGFEPEWLVQEGGVNAFAALGPDGSLTWSRRDARARGFDLMVRRGGVVTRMSGEGLRSYVYPSFNADGSRVFVMVLRDGILELGSVDPTSEDAMRQSLVRAFISDRADDATAAQMVTPQGTRDGIDGRDLLFFHPTVQSISRWNDTDGLRPIAGGAVAMSRVDERRLAVLDGGRVRIRAANLDPAGAAREPGAVILEQVAVPRYLGVIEDAPAILLMLPEANGVRLMIARLVQ
jgi:hypothetical protein